MKLKAFGITVLVLVLLIVIMVGSAIFYVNYKLSKVQKISLHEDDLDISTEVDENLADYRNIALFGIDSRADTYSRGNRSDCIIIASINNKTNEVKLTSVYRDTMVKIKGHGLDKITHAYSFGEAELAINTLNTNLDLNIKEFVAVNFDAVADAVDELGGVDINIESQEEMKYLNGYQVETSKVTGKPAKNITSTGVQTLDGVQAVAYSRIRYTEGGDQKRAERMRIVVEAMLKKAKTLGVGEINSFLDHVLPKVYTNISTKDMIATIPSLLKYKIVKSIGWPYETKGITLDRWYGVPITLESNVTQLHKEIFDEPDYTPTETVKEISDSIVGKTGYGK